jgi:hypothetical protein
MADNGLILVQDADKHLQWCPGRPVWRHPLQIVADNGLIHPQNVGHIQWCPSRAVWQVGQRNEWVSYDTIRVHTWQAHERIASQHSHSVRSFELKTVHSVQDQVVEGSILLLF